MSAFKNSNIVVILPIVQSDEFYKYKKLCKCGRSFLAKSGREQKCPQCKKRQRIKVTYNPLAVREAHARDHFHCRFCGVDVSQKPMTVKFHDIYYTACSSHAKQARLIRRGKIKPHKII